MHPLQRGKTARILTGLLIAFAVLGAALFSAGSAAAQENGLASITLYASLCPEGYTGDDFYADCYDTPAGAGIDYTLTDLNDTSRTYAGSSGASGFAAIEGIDEDGFYQLTFDVPFAITDAPGNCSEDGAAFPVGSEYQFNLTTDNDIRCDLFITPAAEDGENGLASITIYKAFCPLGYTGTAYYADCYDNPGGEIDFTLTNLDTGESVDGTTNGNGFVAFEGIDTAGSYELSEDIPGDFNDIFVDCSEDGADFPVSNDGNFVAFDLTTDNDIRCDWYNIPVDSQGADDAFLTVNTYECPAGYAESGYFADCDTPLEGVEFDVSSTADPVGYGAPTDTDGVVVFDITELVPDTIRLTEEAPAGLADYAVFCGPAGGQEGIEIDYVEGETAIEVALGPGANLVCNWFNIPGVETGAGSLTIYKTACPAGYTGTDYYKDCYDNPRTGIGFGAFAPKLDFSVSGKTGANGFVTLPLPDETSAGGILVTESPNIEVPAGGNPPFFVYCTVDGQRLDVTYSLIQLDPGGDAYAASISPEAGDDVRCDWYNLTPKTSTPSPSPSPRPISTQPVTQLPSTGAGDAAGTSFDGVALGLSLLTIGGLATAAVVARRRPGKTAA